MPRGRGSQRAAPAGRRHAARHHAMVTLPLFPQPPVSPNLAWTCLRAWGPVALGGTGSGPRALSSATGVSCDDTSSEDMRSLSSLLSAPEAHPESEGVFWGPRRGLAQVPSCRHDSRAWAEQGRPLSPLQACNRPTLDRSPASWLQHVSQEEWEHMGPQRAEGEQLQVAATQASLLPHQRGFPPIRFSFYQVSAYYVC